MPSDQQWKFRKIDSIGTIEDVTYRVLPRGPVLEGEHRCDGCLLQSHLSVIGCWRKLDIGPCKATEREDGNDVIFVGIDKRK